MKKLQVSIMFLFAIAMTGCASITTPDTDLINKLPVVQVGSKKPVGNEYVLYIPAGKEFPVNFNLGGKLISKSLNNRMSTKINQDLYIYKYWSSLDKKNWLPSHDLINMQMNIGVDGEGAKVNILVDRK